MNSPATKSMMSESYELNELLIEIFPELEFYINDLSRCSEESNLPDEIIAAQHEITVDYYQQEFKL